MCCALHFFQACHLRKQRLLAISAELNFNGCIAIAHDLPNSVDWVFHIFTCKEIMLWLLRLLNVGFGLCSWYNPRDFLQGFSLQIEILLAKLSPKFNLDKIT